MLSIQWPVVETRRLREWSGTGIYLNEISSPQYALLPSRGPVCRQANKWA